MIISSVHINTTNVFLTPPYPHIPGPGSTLPSSFYLFHYLLFVLPATSVSSLDILRLYILRIICLLTAYHNRFHVHLPFLVTFFPLTLYSIQNHYNSVCLTLTSADLLTHVCPTCFELFPSSTNSSHSPPIGILFPPLLAPLFTPTQNQRIYD